MKIVKKNISELIFAEYNSRRLTKDQFASLKKSLEGFGVVEPAVVNMNPERRNIVIGGHQRIRVAREMGMKDFPCVEVNLSLERERELNIRLNRNVGEWDFELMGKNFEIMELLEWGFSKKELDLGGLNKILEEEKNKGEAIHEQAVQLLPDREYVVIMAEGEDEWIRLREIFGLKTVRRGGYKKGSAFDSLGIDRVVKAKKFIEIVEGEKG